ncbi:hypothetical protein ACSFA2_00620 [Variovorax sp. LT2P21]|uniref:hypothetical protein n=1 Tax=Variovorax sp. LT2P21 TaxID=3443731 RepID=UPI003F468143
MTRSSDAPASVTRFLPGAPSPNPNGRPTRLALALRGLEPLRQMGVTDDELAALARAEVGGSPQCRVVLVDLIDRRLRAAAAPATTVPVEKTS